MSAFPDGSGECLPDELRAVLHPFQLLGQGTGCTEGYHPAVTLGMSRTGARSAPSVFLVFHFLMLWKTKVTLYLKYVIRLSKFFQFRESSNLFQGRSDAVVDVLDCACEPAVFAALESAFGVAHLYVRENSYALKYDPVVILDSPGTQLTVVVVP